MTYQPQVILVGPNLAEIQTCYIQVDNERYLMPSVLEAMDGCYKLIHVLSAEYSKVCLQSWYLLQRCVFECRCQEDSITSDLLRIEQSLNEKD